MIAALWPLLLAVAQGGPSQGVPSQGAPRRPASAASQAALPVQMGFSIDPDTVTVGDPFRLTVRIHAPLGASVEFPVGPDSGATVEALDPKQERQTPDSTALDLIGTWRLAAWDIGDQPLRIQDVVVRFDGRERRIPLSALRVHVRSVLPADTAQRIPKPQRAIFEFGLPWWYWLLAALAVIGLIGLFWWWWHRRRKGRQGRWTIRTRTQKRSSSASTDWGWWRRVSADDMSRSWWRCCARTSRAVFPTHTRR